MEDAFWYYMERGNPQKHGGIWQTNFASGLDVDGSIKWLLRFNVSLCKVCANNVLSGSDAARQRSVGR